MPDLVVWLCSLCIIAGALWAVRTRPSERDRVDRVALDVATTLERARIRAIAGPADEAVDLSKLAPPEDVTLAADPDTRAERCADEPRWSTIASDTIVFEKGTGRVDGARCVLVAARDYTVMVVIGERITVVKPEP